MATTQDVLKALLRNADKEIGGGASALHRFLARVILAVVAIITGGASATPGLLTTLASGDLGDGNHRYVISNDQFYILDTTSVSVVDGNLVVATDTGTGRWIQYPYRSLFRTLWTINQATGSDPNGSGAALSPIASYGELQRRIGIHRGLIPTTAQVRIVQVGNYAGNVMLDLGMSTVATLPPIIEGTVTVGAAGAITATAVVAGIRTINTVTVLAVGDIIRIAGNGAIARVISITGAPTYEISAFTIQDTGAVYVPLAEAFNVVTLPTIDGTVYLDTVGLLTLQRLDILNSSANDGFIADGGYLNLISMRIRGASSALNRIEADANIFAYGTFFELTTPLLLRGALQHQTGNLYSLGVAGLRVIGGRALFVGGTAAGGDAAAIMQGSATPTPSAANRSYLRVGPAGYAQLGNDAGTTGQLITRACTTGIWVEAMGLLRQTAGAAAVPTGTSAAGAGTTEGIRIDSLGRYVYPSAATLPTIVPGTATQDILLGGVYLIPSTLPATNGVDTPSAKYVGSGGVNIIPTATRNHGFATANGVRGGAGVYTLTTIPQMSVDAVISLEMATQDAWGVGVRTAPTTIIVHTYVTVAGANVATDTDFTITVRDPSIAGTGSGTNGAAMVMAS